jgi:hypothetical protein
LLVRREDDKPPFPMRRHPLQYALLIYNKPDVYDGFTEQESQAVAAEYLAVRGDSRITSSAKLAPVETATTIRVQDGDALVTDGPFADTKEVFGGFYLLEADDIEAALELAARMPAARLGGSVEIRPVEFQT